MNLLEMVLAILHGSGIMAFACMEATRGRLSWSYDIFFLIEVKGKQGLKVMPLFLKVSLLSFLIILFKLCSLENE